MASEEQDQRGRADSAPASARDDSHPRDMSQFRMPNLQGKFVLNTTMGSDYDQNAKGSTTNSPHDVNEIETVDLEQSASDGSVSSRNRRSKVWKDFTEKEEDGLFSAICNHCQSELTSGNKSGTSHQKSRKRKGGTPRSDIPSFDQQRSRQDYAKMITAHNYPFMMAEHYYTRCLDKAAIVEADLATTTAVASSPGPTVTEVEEVKMVAKLLPIWSTCILFWTIYSQMTTFSIEQAEQMDRPVGGAGFAVPAGSLSVFLFLSILLFTSLNERLLVPLAGRLTGRPHGLTSLQRVAAGLALATLAMAVAALVEKKRRDVSAAQESSNGGPVSAFWLVAQFFLVAAGEAFAYVGQLEFFIREAPERMKSMSTGLFLTTLAMGFFLSSLLVLAVDAVTRGAWIRGHLDDGRLDLFYWMLAVLGVVNFVVFLVFASRHQYKRTGHEHDAAAVVEPGEEENVIRRP